MRVQSFIGTEKGAFILTSDGDRRSWAVEGPFFKGWKVTAAHRLPDGTFLAATSSWVFGPGIHRSSDLREWEPVEQGPSYAEDSGRKLNQIWTFASAHGRVWAGVDEAGLFVSDDAGVSWNPVPGLNDHETREKWFPGAGGLCAHVILPDPGNPDRIWAGISAVGVFRSEDGGATWVPKNRGVRMVIEDEEVKEIGFCVHSLAHDPENPEHIFRQDHAGMYRSFDGGESWEPNAEGLPANFGFPIERDPASGRLFSVPLESDEFRLPPEGRLRVYCSDDDGATWFGRGEGLPEANAWAGPLRGALALDGLDPCGVYMGTTSGTVHVSADRGDTWQTLPFTFPRILSVAAFSDG